MDRETVLSILQGHEDELRGLGISRLSLFGSAARSEADPLSDIDIAVTFSAGPRGFAHLERMDRVKAKLSRMLEGMRVDLIEEPSPSLRIQKAIDEDRVLAF
jgi:predicted nucleotidyltransferase